MYSLQPPLAEFPPAHTDDISFPSGLSFSLLLLPMNFPLLFMMLDVNVMVPTYPRGNTLQDFQWVLPPNG